MASDVAAVQYASAGPKRKKKARRLTAQTEEKVQTSMLRPITTLTTIVGEFQGIVLEVIEDLPISGVSDLVTPLADISIELNRVYQKLAKDDQLAGSIIVMVRAAYLLGHHGASKNGLALARRLATSAARRKRNFHPDQEEFIQAAIYKHTAGWDGSNPTEMSQMIAADLEGPIGERQPRTILNRLNKQILKRGREV